MELEELVSVLIAEHAKMKEGLAQVRQATSNKNFASASSILKELDQIFRQHIADEEARVLRILLDAYGVEGSEEAIVVFRQHRPIYELMEEVKKLASLPVGELAGDQDRLWRLFEDHTLAEGSRIFPKAIRTFKERTS
jgi:hemerythrin-like domain-containing protein